MSYRSILTVLETEATAKSILSGAVDVAKAQGGHLIGLHAIPATPIQPSFGYSVPVEVWNAMRSRAEERATALKGLFEDAVAAEDGIESEWRVASSPSWDVADTVLEHARRADLIIIGQVDRDHSDGSDFELAGSLLLEAGRPVLVLPYAKSMSTVGHNVLVAWNGSRESARAVFDALPFLKDAKEVHILGVNRDRGDEAHPLMPGSELATTLARHGVSVILDTLSDVSSGIAQEVLSRAADRGSDLIVMGGYGRSRARERIFGGVTRTMLETMTVPVLISH